MNYYFHSPKNTGIFFKQNQTKTQEALDGKMIEPTDTFSIDTSLKLEGEWTFWLTCLNV